MGLVALLVGSPVLQLLGLLALGVVAWLLLSRRDHRDDPVPPMEMGPPPELSWFDRVMPIAFAALAALVVLALLIYTLIQLGVW
jgi:hypothetical protein